MRAIPTGEASMLSLSHKPYASATVTNREIADAIWDAIDEVYGDGYGVARGGPDESEVFSIIHEVQKRLIPENGAHR